MKLSPALSAFLAGMLLGESPFATQIRSDIGSIRTLFVTLFFTSVGMLAEPLWLVTHIKLVFSGLAAVFVGKLVIIYLLCRLFKVSNRQALATGITLAQVGEFSFVLANVARAGGALSAEVFSLIISVSILSLLLSPYMVTYALPLSDAFFSRLLRVRGSSTEQAEQQNGAICELIIVGFGPAGQRIAEALLEKQIYPRIIELINRWGRAGAIGGYLGLGRVRQAQDDLDAAHEAIQAAEKLALKFEAMKEDDEFVASEKARLWLAQRDIEAGLIVARPCHRPAPGPLAATRPARCASLAALYSFSVMIPCL